MVLLDFTKEDLENLLEVFDHDNFLDYDDDNKLHELRGKISKYLNQKDFVYIGNELLDEEQAESLLKDLERKPTQEEINDLRESLEFARRIKTYTNGYCYKCEKEKDCDYFRDVCEECF
jgi:ATP phosphoribosyltransferase regulatory subunit HisZ